MVNVPQNIVEFSIKDKIDLYEARLLQLPPAPYLREDVFTPGMYSRELYMLAGTSWTSEIHNTEHQYVVLEGSASIFTEEEGEVFICAPKKGITKPGTKRVLFIHENMRWITFHATDIMPVDDSKEAKAAAVAKIKDQIIQFHENKFHIGNNIHSQIEKE